MTFKTNVKFDDSPVLRSLERVAISRGLVTPAPIVKKAEDESYKLGNLHDDMLHLVSLLRSKGFVKEADDLEDKVNIYAFAKSKAEKAEKTKDEGEKLLDLAHPEGDVEVAPSSSGLGKVWTEQSAHREILKAVNKTPTGKNASVKTAQFRAEAISQEDAIKWISLNARAYVNNLLTVLDDKPKLTLYWRKGAVHSVPIGAGRIGDSLEDIGNALTPNVIEYLKFQTEEAGYDPRFLMRQIQGKMIANYQNGKWFVTSRIPLVGDALIVSLLWEAGKNGENYYFIDDDYSNNAMRTKEYYYKIDKAKRESEAEDKLDIVTDEHKNSLLLAFNAAIEAIKALYADLGKAKNTSKNKINALEFQLKKVIGWRKAVKGLVVPAEFATLRNALGTDFINSTNIFSLVAWAQEDLILMLINDIKKVASSTGFVKGSQPASTLPPSYYGENKGDGKGEGTGVKEKPTATTSKPVQKGAVSAIQKSLLELANLAEQRKDPPEVVKTLRMEGYGNDNYWGPVTQAAVRMAETIRAKHAPSLPPIVVSNTTSTADALNTLLNVLKGTSAGGGYKQEAVKVYDKYPDATGVDLTALDLSSLNRFYSWLINNGVKNWEIKNDDQGYEIVMANDFTAMIKEIVDRAKTIHSSFKENPTLSVEHVRAGNKLYVEYVRSANNLYAQWVNLVKNITPKTGWDQYINNDKQHPYVYAQQLVLFSNVGAGAIFSGERPPGGAGYDQATGQAAKPVPGVTGKKTGGQADGLKVELAGETSGYTVADVPISRYLDLSNTQWWGRMGSDLLLDFDEIGSARMTGGQFADLYFSGDSGRAHPGMQLYQAAVQTYGRDAVRLDPAGLGKTLVQAQGKWYYAEQFPDIMRTYNMLGANPDYHAVNFLSLLRSQISNVVNEWNSLIENPEVRRELLPEMTKWGRKWQEKLGKMVGDIGRRRRMERGF